MLALALFTELRITRNQSGKLSASQYIKVQGHSSLTGWSGYGLTTFNYRLGVYFL